VVGVLSDSHETVLAVVAYDGISSGLLRLRVLDLLLCLPLFGLMALRCCVLRSVVSLQLGLL